MVNFFDAAPVAEIEPPSWEPGEEYDAVNPPAPPQQEDTVREGVVPLGHDRGVFYYYSLAARQVFPLAAAQHSKNTLAAMASVAHYWQRSMWVNDKGAVQWDDAIDFLMCGCRQVGIYDPDKIRGRGAWIDNGRSVLHTGRHLIVDGERSELMLEGSTSIYEAAKPLTKITGAPLRNGEAYKLVEICNGLPWQHGLSGTLLSGFIVVAPICGGLMWRPSIWVTGGAGSGKTYAKENIVSPAMGGVALQVQSKTSEAGIRQTLGCDALPVIFDEAEREDASSASRMQGVLDLLRQSSSEGGAEIVKGSQSQTGAKRYRIRSCFMLSSINVGIEHQADESRITILALRDRDPRTAAEAEAKFAVFNRLVQETITPEFAAGLLARSVRLLPIIRKNAETFARVVAVVLGSRRTGDQLGTLLAGAYALHSEAEISDDAAEKWVREKDFGSSAGGDVDRDERQLINHVIQHRIRVSGGNAGTQDVSIGRLIMAAADLDASISAHTAHDALCEHGIRFDRVAGERGVYISTNHRALKQIMIGTPWSAGWCPSLGRLPGAVVGVQKTIRFGKLHTGKAAWVPLLSIDQDFDKPD